VRFVGPAAHVNGVKKAAEALGFKDITDTVPWREAFSHWTDEELPGKALAGARHKEGLTQVQLAQMTGIPQRHLSEMEHGKRPIGKDTAKKLAKALHVHYRIFL
jgi:ribosome-binding protein aMBF1 (putative translation factor)